MSQTVTHPTVRRSPQLVDRVTLTRMFAAALLASDRCTAMNVAADGTSTLTFTSGRRLRSIVCRPDADGLYDVAALRRALPDLAA